MAEPGTRKSAVYRALTAPLYAAEHVLNDGTDEDRYEKQVLRERLEEVDKKAREKAVKDGSQDVLKAAAARELDELRIPVPVQLITGDISPEECTTILDAQGGRLAIMSAEGRVFDIITGRYSNGEPCLSPFLEGHAGDPLRVNRRGRYEYIERPALTIGVCIQPAVLQWIADKPRLRGQGLLARFDYSVPPDLVGYRESEPPAASEEVRTAYDTALKAMVLSLAHWEDPMVLTLTSEARKVAVEYLALIEPRLRPDGDLYGVRDWAAKLAGGTVRKAVGGPWRRGVPAKRGLAGRVRVVTGRRVRRWVCCPCTPRRRDRVPGWRRMSWVSSRMHSRARSRLLPPDWQRSGGRAGCGA